MRRVSGPGPRLRISGVNGGKAPVWSPDGRSVLYLDGSKVMSTRVDPGPTPSVSQPHLAFALPFSPSMSGAPLSVFVPSPDGKRLAVKRPDRAAYQETHRLQVITDFAEKLKAKVPWTR